MAFSLGAELLSPEPSPPARQFSFTDWQVNNPTAPPPGDKLDGEFDRANNAIAQTLAWTGTSLNTDGSLRDGTVGENQLVPGLFDYIANDAIAQVQPLVTEAEAAAGAAAASSGTASAAADESGAQAGVALNAATAAGVSATSALAAAATAQTSAQAAAASADDAGNAANHAAGDAALCENYGLVTQAWAEHMPDTIPPNILAVMGVTGDHWSARWWANRALEIVSGVVSGQLGIFHQPSPPANPGPAALWSRTDGCLFIWDSSLSAWIQLSGLSL